MPFYYERNCSCDGDREGVFDFSNLCEQIDCPDCGQKDAIEIGWETEHDLEAFEE